MIPRDQIIKCKATKLFNYFIQLETHNSFTHTHPLHTHTDTDADIDTVTDTDTVTLSKVPFLCFTVVNATQSR